MTDAVARTRAENTGDKTSGHSEHQQVHSMLLHDTWGPQSDFKSSFTKSNDTAVFSAQLPDLHIDLLDQVVGGKFETAPLNANAFSIPMTSQLDQSYVKSGWLPDSDDLLNSLSQAENALTPAQTARSSEMSLASLNTGRDAAGSKVFVPEHGLPAPGHHVLPGHGGHELPGTGSCGLPGIGGHELPGGHGVPGIGGHELPGGLGVPGIGGHELPGGHGVPGIGGHELPGGHGVPGIGGHELPGGHGVPGAGHHGAPGTEHPPGCGTSDIGGDKHKPKGGRSSRPGNGHGNSGGEIGIGIGSGTESGGQNSPDDYQSNNARRPGGTHKVEIHPSSPSEGEGVRPEGPEKPAGPEKPGQPEKPESPTKPENPEKPDSPESPENKQEVERPWEKPEPGSMTNVEARDWYNEKVKQQIDEIENQMRREGKSEEEILETRHALRNQAKQDARDAMRNREDAKRLDKTDPLLPLDVYLEKYGGDYEKATAASKRTNAEVNQKIEEERKIQAEQEKVKANESSHSKEDDR